MEDFRVFKDLTENGPMFVVYFGHRCHGVYSKDHSFIKQLELVGVEFDEGLDCRESERRINDCI